MSVTTADWYDTPLYYDIVFDADTEKEGDFLEAVMCKHSELPRISSLRVLEPACGSGRLVAELALRGHEVSGFDGNERMLDYARQRLTTKKCKAVLWGDRLEGFSTPTPEKFDFAHCLVSTFKYLQDEAGAVSHLKHVAAALRKGGLYALGLHLSDYASHAADHERWVAEREGIRVVCNTHTWPADRRLRSERLRARLKVTRRGQTFTQETHWHFRTYSAAQMRALLKQVPTLQLMACYDFTYNIHSPRKLDDSYADVVLVLRRR